MELSFCAKDVRNIPKYSLEMQSNIRVLFSTPFTEIDTIIPCAAAMHNSPLRGNNM